MRAGEVVAQGRITGRNEVMEEGGAHYLAVNNFTRPDNHFTSQKGWMVKGVNCYGTNIRPEA